MITFINPRMQKRFESELSVTQSEVSLLLEFFPKGVCAFDLEMTGLSPIFDKIIEIAAIKILPSGKVETFHTLINPLIPIPEHTIQYHGLTNEILRNAPALKKPFKEFQEFYEHLPLIAHNAQFDIGFLVIALNELNLNPSLSDIYDSCKAARALLRNSSNPPKSFKLNDLAQYYAIEFDHHKALDDALVCLKIFIQALKFIKENDPKLNIKNIGFLYKLNSFQKSTSYILPNKFSKLKTYVTNQTDIYIKYKGGSHKGSFRPIKPIALLALPNGVVLYAVCLKSNMNKYFHIRKLQAISVEKPSS